MRHILTSIMAVCAAAIVSHACMGPANIEGVAFTSGETIDVQKLMELGTENVNYVKEGKAPDIGIRFKSHYDGRAMVFIGTYGLTFAQNTSVHCMGVVLPLPDSAKAYSKIDKSIFDFAAAVKAELAWLASKGAINVTAARIDAIGAALDGSGNGGMQYWTHVDKVLAYNQWYVKDSLSGVWSSGGVNGVRSLDAVTGCSVIRPGSGLPPQGIGTTGVTPASYRVNAPLAIRQLGNAAAVVFLHSRQIQAKAFVSVVDCKGAVVLTKRVPVSGRSLYITGLAPGYYTARFSY